MRSEEECHNVKLDDEDVERIRSGDSSSYNRNGDSIYVRKAVNHRHSMEREGEGDGMVQWGLAGRTGLADDSLPSKPGEDDVKAFTLPPAPSTRNQLKAMRWRQRVFKRRGTGQMFMELISPILMLSLLVLGWTRTTPDHYDAEGFANASLPVSEEFTGALLGSEHLLKNRPPAVLLEQLGSLPELGQIAFVPNTSEVADLVNYMLAEHQNFTEHYGGTFHSEKEAILSSSKGTGSPHWAVVYVKHLDLSGGNVDYTIRMNYTTVRGTSRVVQIHRHGLIDPYRHYFTSGFLSLQNAISSYVLRKFPSTNPEGKFVDETVWAVPFPVGEYTGNMYYVEWTSSAIQLLLNGLSTSSGADGVKRQHGWLEERVEELLFRVLEDGVGIDIRNPSPVTKNLRLVTSPVPVVSCIALYIATVWLWSSHIKKSEQKPRKEDPLPLRCLVIVHNLFLCILSLFMGIGLLLSARQLGYSLWGNVYRGDEAEMGFLIYVFYASKLYEFMDTAIMLFRRNLRQLTYLHVYHHASITFIWWIICYTSPGADAYFSAAFNSCIHVAMYLYYLLAATVAKDDRRRRKYLFWGKYLTMMQMVQFLSFIAQSIYAMLRPETYPRGMPRLLFFYSISLLAFFGNFFVKKYSRPQKSVKTN